MQRKTQSLWSKWNRAENRFSLPDSTIDHLKIVRFKVNPAWEVWYALCRQSGAGVELKRQKEMRHGDCNSLRIAAYFYMLERPREVFNASISETLHIRNEFLEIGRK
jgi:hypothetical protein